MYESWDADQVSAEPDLTESETLDYSQECDEDEHVQGAWSFEPEEKDDSIDDYEFLTSSVEVETSPITLSSTPQLTTVELLIQTFQTASTWEEISKALKTHEDCKQAAWDALTRTQRKRVMEITPRTIKRLNHAKREGLIADFREFSSGVYEIRYNGSLLWETVFEYRMEEFFAQLLRVFQKLD
ncbi:hypothetical protein RIVM261_025560 [Rivularia sp. IAM M-261]|nr:hypothetical protein RIVM261_025560 [Rivularia sp. IAM M-261]